MPELRSPFARAVVPVLGGMGVFAVLGLLTWGIAAYISGDSDRTDALFQPTYEVGPVEPLSQEVAENGPILMQGLDTSSEKRNVLLNHVGDDPAQGWRVYFAYPADADDSCPVRQVRGTAEFIDCKDRRLDVSDLAPAAGVSPVVENLETLSIDLRGAIADSTATSTG